jgi:hypothetical protein
MNKIFFQRELNTMHTRAKQNPHHFSFFPGETARMYDHENITTSIEAVAEFKKDNISFIYNE